MNNHNLFFEIKKNYSKGKKIKLKECTKPVTRGCRLRSDAETLRVYIVYICVILPQIRYQIVPYAWEFLPNKSYFNVYIKNPCFRLQKNVPRIDEVTRVISAITGKNGVSFAHRIS